MGLLNLISNSANLKQAYVPFVLVPGANLNTAVSNSTQCAGKTPQKFSYKLSSLDGKGTATSDGRLNICPSSFINFMSSDIGHRLLYDFRQQNGILQNGIMPESILDNIPGLQIREYEPDTIIDQLINLVKDLGKIFSPTKKDKSEGAGKTAPSADTRPDAEQAKATESAENKFEKLIKKIQTMFSSTAFYEKVCSGAITDYIAGDIYNGASALEDLAVLKFPMSLYYRIQSAVTTNVYEVPINIDTLYESNGTEGLNGDNAFRADFGQSAMEKLGMGLGKFLSRTLNTVAIEHQQVWDPSGTSHTGREIVTNFSLYNDTADAAIKNFIFVNTIVPNNMWYQYSMFKRPPAFYDIKCEGFDRMYCCSGKFSVKSRGPLRTLPKEMLMRLAYLHTNSGGSYGNVNASALKNNILTRNIVKIPDIYDVQLTFQSLLPNNFNNFIYRYFSNRNIIEQTAGNAYNSNIIANFVQAIKSFFDE